MDRKFAAPRRLAAVFAALLAVQAPAARAGMVGTEAALAHEQATADRAKVEAFLERANVVEKMRAMGVDGIAAQERVAALSEEEAHALAQRIDSLPAGAALATTDIIIILLAVILLAIVL